MSEQKNHHQHQSSGPPHKTLGKYLKSLRQKFQESLGETSGAVEIMVEQLDRFERGSELPSEDILLLLISHFALQDDEAVELWDLAGYDRDHDHGFAQVRDSKAVGGQAGAADDNQTRQALPVMLLALDNRVLYSNGVEVISDDAGMVLNFLQSHGQPFGQSQFQPGTQKIPVSRIGMSHDQAQQLLEILERALLHKKYLGGPKQLPPPKK